MELVLSQKEPSDTLLGLLEDIQDWFFGFWGVALPYPLNVRPQATKINR